jgi:hypothetical protein
MIYLITISGLGSRRHCPIENTYLNIRIGYETDIPNFFCSLNDEHGHWDFKNVCKH